MDEQAIKKLVSENRSLAEKIVDVLKGIIEKISSLITGETNSTEAKMLKESKEVYEKCLETWVRGIDGTEESTEADTKMSLKDIVDEFGNEVMNSKEYASFYSMIGEIKNGKNSQFARSRNNEYILEIGNKLVYTDGKYNNPTINKVITIDVKEDNDYESTYTAFAQGDIIKYEREQKHIKTELREFTQSYAKDFNNVFGRQVNIGVYEGNNTKANWQNRASGRQGEVRNAVNYHFGDEQDTGRNIGEGKSNSDIEVKAKFSLKDTYEETENLIAVHNITESNLKKTLALGGFPMPSIAITKAEIGHTNFGDISVLFRKDTIDPADRRNKVYGSDAWTPMFPSMNDTPRMVYCSTTKERSVSAEAITDALTKPLHICDIKTDSEGRRSQRFIGKDATVNINPDSGIITTTWKTGERMIKKYRKDE